MNPNENEWSWSCSNIKSIVDCDYIDFGEKDLTLEKAINRTCSIIEADLWGITGFVIHKSNKTFTLEEAKRMLKLSQV